jgi:hypothetical protein
MTKQRGTGLNTLFALALQLATAAGCQPEPGAAFFTEILGLDAPTRAAVLVDLSQLLLGSRMAGDHLVMRLQVLDSLQPELGLRTKCRAMLASMEATHA